MKKLAIILLSSAAFLAEQSGQAQLAGSAVAASAATNLPTAAAAGGATAARGPCHTGNAAMCVIVGLSLAQVAAGLLTKSKANQSASDLSSAATDTSGTSGSGTTTGSTTGSLGLDDSQSLTSAANTSKVAAALAGAGLGGLVSDYQKNAAAVNAAGLNVATDGSKVTLPNGKSVSGTSLGSAQSMVDAGFSPSDASAAQDFINGQNANANSANSKKVASLTNADGASGGGGAGGSGGAGGGGSSSSSYDSLAAMKAAMAKNANGGVSGMSKKFGSDNIGVSGDNIFEMVSRRYKARDQASSFIKN